MTQKLKNKAINLEITVSVFFIKVRSKRCLKAVSMHVSPVNAMSEDEILTYVNLQIIKRITF